MTDATQQTDPFSELRGLMASATKAVDECPINSKNPRHAQADRSKACKRCGARDNERCGMIDGTNYSVAKAAQALVPALLDERDRLRALLTSMVHAIDTGNIDSVELDGEPEVGIPPHRWHEEWVYSARQALSQEIG